MFIHIVCFQFVFIGLENPMGGGGVVKLVYIYTYVSYQIASLLLCVFTFYWILLEVWKSILNKSSNPRIEVTPLKGSIPKVVIIPFLLLFPPPPPQKKNRKEKENERLLEISHPRLWNMVTQIKKRFFSKLVISVNAILYPFFFLSSFYFHRVLKHSLKELLQLLSIPFRV